MPFNGNGQFTLKHTWVNEAAAGVPILATNFDDQDSDIATALSNTVTRDGQSTPLANLPMGGYKFTGLGTGSAATDSVNFGQVFNSPTFTTPLAASSPSASDNPLRLATVGMVLSTAFQTALPTQSLGLLASDGTHPSFTQSISGFALNAAKGADIPSAATIDLTSPTGEFMHVTGTTTIGTITVPVGAMRALIFDGVLTLTNGPALKLPGNADIVTQAGDRVTVRGDTGCTTVVSYMRADGSALVSNFVQAGTGAVVRTKQAKERDVISVRDFTGDTVDGVTSNQAGIVAAVAAAIAAGAALYWPAGTYVSTATIASLHSVRHIGPGIIKRGSDLFYVAPTGSQTNNLYISPSGTGDGLSATEPSSEAGVFTALLNYGPVLDGQWNVRLAAGTYPGGVTMTGLRSRNYLAFYGPNVGGHPNVPTAIIDGTGSPADHGWYFQTNMTLKVQDIKFQNWTTKSYSHGITVLEASKLYTVNVHTSNCTYGGVDIEDRSQLILSGGIHNNTQYCIRAAYHCTVSIGYNGATAGRPQITGATAGGSGILLSDYSQGHIDYCDIYGCAGSGGAVGLVNMSRVDLNNNVFGAGTPNYYNVSCSIGSTYIDNVGNTFNAATAKSIVLLGFSLDWSNNGNVFYDQATGRLRIGPSTSYSAPPAPLYVKNGDASASYASSTVLAIESTTSPYISLGSPGTTEGGILWSKPSVSTQAKFFYNFTDDTFRMLVAAGSTVYKWGATFFVPPTDNAVSNGSATFRWSVVYAGTGTINTSDEREKQQIKGIEPAVLRAVRRISFVQFKFNDAVEVKGDGARWHFGVIAQRVKEAFEAEGLDPFAYGLLCYDEWSDQYEPVVAERDVEIDGPDGQMRTIKESYHTGEMKLVQPAGNRYGVRHDELFALKLAAIEASA